MPALSPSQSILTWCFPDALGAALTSILVTIMPCRLLGFCMESASDLQGCDTISISAPRYIVRSLIGISMVASNPMHAGVARSSRNSRNALRCIPTSCELTRGADNVTRPTEKDILVSVVLLHCLKLVTSESLFDFNVLAGQIFPCVPAAGQMLSRRARAIEGWLTYASVLEMYHRSPWEATTSI